jgi:hypothetical protein
MKSLRIVCVFGSTSASDSSCHEETFRISFGFFGNLPKQIQESIINGTEFYPVVFADHDNDKAPPTVGILVLQWREKPQWFGFLPRAQSGYATYALT